MKRYEAVRMESEDSIGWGQDEDEGTEEEREDTTEEVRQRERKWRTRKYNTDLIGAVLDNNYEEVKRLITKEGVPPTVRCQERMVSVVHLAALRGSVEILQLLLDNGRPSAEEMTLRTRLRDSQGVQPHHLAAAAGQLATLRLLLQRDPSLIDSQVVREEDPPVVEDHLDSFLHDHSTVTLVLITVTGGSTALHNAAKRSYVDLVTYLIDLGADVNVKDKDGLTPLDVAGLYANPMIPGTIVSAAEPAEYCPEDEEELIGGHATDSVPIIQPLSKLPTSFSNFKKPKRSWSVPPVALNANVTLNVVKTLMTHGAQLGDDPSSKESTPLHRAVEEGKIEELADLLTELKKDNRTMRYPKDGKGRTPVHRAVEQERLDLLKLLLEKCPEEVNTQDNEGLSPLHVAVLNRWETGVQVLLEYSPDLGRMTNQGKTVLHFAVGRPANERLLQDLLQLATTKVVNERDKEGYSALFRAVEAGDVPCVELLLERRKPQRRNKRDNNSILHVAVKANAVTVLKTLILRMELHTSHYNKPNNDGLNPVQLAVMENTLLCLEVLLDSRRVDLLQRIDREEGGTILHLAARLGHSEAVKMLLEESAVVPSGQQLVCFPDYVKREPLILAAGGGHSDCVMELLKHGANLAAKQYNSEKYSGQSALDLIYYNVANAGTLFDNLFDSFVSPVTPGSERDLTQDHPKYEICLDFSCLLADANSRGGGTGVQRRQLGVVEAFIKCKQGKLRKLFFLHPLIESFLYFKWSQLRIFFYLVLSLFVIHNVALTGYALMVYAFDWSGYSWTFRFLALASIIPIIILEMLSLGMDKAYLNDSETWVKWGAVILSALTVLPFDKLSSQEAGDVWPRHLASFAVLLAWVHLLFLFARLPNFGLRVLMFVEVAKNVFQVLSSFLFLIFGFSFSFLILFKGQYPFTDLGTTMSKVLVMMVELDYTSVYGEEASALPLSILVFGRILYLSFIILVVMVLTNLIVGMSVSDVAELEAQGKLRRMEKQASFLVIFERLCYKEDLPKGAHSWIRGRKAAPRTVSIFPNLKRDRTTNPLPRELRSRVLQTVLNREEALGEDIIIARMEELFEEVKELKKLLLENL